MDIISIIVIFHCILEYQPHIGAYFPNIIIPSTIFSLHFAFDSAKIHGFLNNLEFICKMLVET